MWDLFVCGTLLFDITRLETTPKAGEKTTSWPCALWNWFMCNVASTNIVLIRLPDLCELIFKLWFKVALSKPQNKDLTSLTDDFWARMRLGEFHAYKWSNYVWTLWMTQTVYASLQSQASGNRCLCGLHEWPVTVWQVDAVGNLRIEIPEQSTWWAACLVMVSPAEAGTRKSASHDIHSL